MTVRRYSKASMAPAALAAALTLALAGCSSGPSPSPIRHPSPAPRRIAKFGKLYGHTGELPGFNSFAGHDPANQVTLVVWTNLAPTPDGRDPATTIARTLIGKIYR